MAIKWWMLLSLLQALFVIPDINYKKVPKISQIAYKRIFENGEYKINQIQKKTDEARLNSSFSNQTMSLFRRFCFKGREPAVSSQISSCTAAIC